MLSSSGQIESLEVELETKRAQLEAYKIEIESSKVNFSLFYYYCD